MSSEEAPDSLRRPGRTPLKPMRCWYCDGTKFRLVLKEPHIFDSLTKTITPEPWKDGEVRFSSIQKRLGVICVSCDVNASSGEPDGGKEVWQEIELAALRPTGLSRTVQRARSIVQRFRAYEAAAEPAEEAAKAEWAAQGLSTETDYLAMSTSYYMTVEKKRREIAGCDFPEDDLNAFGLDMALLLDKLFPAAQEPETETP